MAKSESGGGGDDNAGRKGVPEGGHQIGDRFAHDLGHRFEHKWLRHDRSHFDQPPSVRCQFGQTGGVLALQPGW